MHKVFDINIENICFTPACACIDLRMFIHIHAFYACKDVTQCRSNSLIIQITTKLTSSRNYLGGPRKLNNM